MRMVTVWLQAVWPDAATISLGSYHSAIALQTHLPLKKRHVLT